MLDSCVSLVVHGSLIATLPLFFFNRRYGSGAVMATAAVLFAFTRNYALCMFLALIFGCGFGAFSVMDWAMATGEVFLRC